MISSISSLLQQPNISSVRAQSQPQKDELRAAVDDFVSILMAQVFKDMDQSIPRSGLIDESFGQKWFREMLYDEYAKSASREALRPLGDALYNQLSAAYHSR